MMTLSHLLRGLAAAALAVCAGTGLAQAADQLDIIQSRGALQVCTTGDYKPFTFHQAATDAYEGIDIELAKSLAKAVGVEPRFVKTKWSELMADFTSGKCDIAMGGISVTLERQKRAFFSAPYLVNGKAPIARCADKDKFQSIAAIDRPEVTVIVNPGGTNERFVRANLKQARIQLFPDNVTIFDEVLAGKADLMVAESIEVKLQEKLRPGLCAINPDQPLQYGEMGYLLPKGDVVFKAFVDQWLHLAKASGEFAKVYDQFVR
ncbi:MAG: Prephenate dehydratase @ Arogenate dehydratase [uncultured Microvirga sp.]|uniref:Prephenate dehydratase @ Arogenate dehydratase n=1 Tax=uncultured Microvirga sp. TaxID=412392 RepID=A0A6J4L1X8_9HYPH|nr:MAG: Prephenate dehydratase @ Arogenate dehydratase [uncultured Microvirga sp.]